MNRNPLPLLIWVISAAALTMILHNPLYTLTLLLVSRLVATGFTSADRQGSDQFYKLSVLIVLFSMLYSAVFVHVGRTVIFRIPPVPLVGGPITLESLVAGFTNGLTLITLLSIFLTLGRLVPASQLVRLTPTALADAGIILMIALNYIPQTRRHFQNVREAQLIRGHRLEGIRDWRPLLIPLLIGGLERSMNLAEAMAARGLGSMVDNNFSTVRRGLMTIALGLTLAGGMVAPLSGIVGYSFMVLGLGLAIALLWRKGGNVRRTVYRPVPWSIVDLAIASAGFIAILLTLFIDRISELVSISYSPYPSLSMPIFDWRIGVILAVMALPMFIAGAPTNRGGLYATDSVTRSE